MQVAVPSTEAISSMPLADLPTNVRLQGSVLSNVISFQSPTNKENMRAVCSSIPIRTPNKELKSGSLTPKLRRAHTFSKSSSDISSVSNRPVKIDKPGYMAATTASKIRVTGPSQPFTEPTSTTTTGSAGRFANNPFK